MYGRCLYAVMMTVAPCSMRCGEGQRSGERMALHLLVMLRVMAAYTSSKPCRRCLWIRIIGARGWQCSSNAATQQSSLHILNRQSSSGPRQTSFRGHSIIRRCKSSADQCRRTQTRAPLPPRRRTPSPPPPPPTVAAWRTTAGRRSLAVGTSTPFFDGRTSTRSGKRSLGMMVMPLGLDG